MSSIGAAPWLTAKPSAPSVWDDEFEGSGLDPAWTRVTGATINTTQDVPYLDPYFLPPSTHYETFRHRPGSYSRQPLASYGSGGYGLTTEGIYRPLVGLPTNCFVWARCSRTGRTVSNIDGDGEVWMTLFNSAAPVNSAYVGMNSFANRPGIVYAKTTAAVPAFTNLGLVENYFNKGNPAEYIGIHKIGNVYHGWTATHTGNWTWLDTVTMAVPLDSVVLSFNNAVGTAPGGMTMHVDFFRVLSGNKIP